MIKGTTNYIASDTALRYHQKNYVQKISLPTAEGLQFKQVNQITHLEASGNYTYIFFIDGKKILVCRTLQEMAQKLEQPFRFVRIHRSSIINMEYIHRYVKGKGGYVILENGVSLAVSSGKKQIFLDAIEQSFR